MSTGILEAANYKQFSPGSVERFSAEMYWNYQQESPFRMNGSQWNIEKGDSKEVGTVHRYVSSAGLMSTAGSNAINGAADVMNLVTNTSTFQRCAEWRGIVKIDEADYNRWMDSGFNPKGQTDEGVRRYLDQQVTPFQMAKLIASANPCNILGSATNPILYYPEFVQGLTGAVTSVKLPSHIYTSLLTRLRKSYGLGAATNYRLLGGVDYSSALGNENKLINTHACCDQNGEIINMKELKGHGVMFDETQWLPRVGVANGKDVYALVLYDTRRVATPMDLLTYRWEQDGFYWKLHARATYGLGVQDSKAIAVAYIQAA